MQGLERKKSSNIQIFFSKIRSKWLSVTINHAAIGAFGLSHDCGNPYAITERPLVAKQLQRGALQLGLGDPNLKPASVYTYLMKVYGLHCEMVDTVLSFDWLSGTYFTVNSLTSLQIMDGSSICRLHMFSHWYIYIYTHDIQNSHDLKVRVELWIPISRSKHSFLVNSLSGM